MDKNRVFYLFFISFKKVTYTLSLQSSMIKFKSYKIIARFYINIVNNVNKIIIFLKRKKINKTFTKLKNFNKLHNNKQKLIIDYLIYYVIFTGFFSVKNKNCSKYTNFVGYFKIIIYFLIR